MQNFLILKREGCISIWFNREAVLHMFSWSSTWIVLFVAPKSAILQV